MHDFGLHLTITGMGSKMKDDLQALFHDISLPHLQADFSFGVFTLG